MRSCVAFGFGVFCVAATIGCADTSAEDRIVKERIAVMNELADLYEKGWEDDRGARRLALVEKLQGKMDNKISAAIQRNQAEYSKAEKRMNDAHGGMRSRVGWLYADPKRELHVLLTFRDTGSPQATLLDHRAVPTHVVLTQAKFLYLNEKEGKKERFGLYPTSDFESLGRPAVHEAGQQGKCYFTAASPQFREKYKPHELEISVEVKGVDHTFQFVEDLKPK